MEENKTIMPGDADPIKLNALMQEQKSGKEWIKERQKQIADRYNIYLKEELIDKGFDQGELKNVVNKIAYEVADLENDFNYIKDLNTTMATRYEEVWNCLPSLTEIDALIIVVENTDAERDTFFCTAKKEDRLKLLKKLRSAIAHAYGTA